MTSINNRCFLLDFFLILCYEHKYMNKKEQFKNVKEGVKINKTGKILLIIAGLLVPIVLSGCNVKDKVAKEANASTKTEITESKKKIKLGKKESWEKVCGDEDVLEKAILSDVGVRYWETTCLPKAEYSEWYNINKDCDYIYSCIRVKYGNCNGYGPFKNNTRKSKSQAMEYPLYVIGKDVNDKALEQSDELEILNDKRPYNERISPKDFATEAIKEENAEILKDFDLKEYIKTHDNNNYVLPFWTPNN